jgi:hypothetical protein
MSKTLGGFVCVRNGFSLDYSWTEAAESLLKVVDQLVLCDSDSTDGTTQAMQRMAEKDSRIKVVNWPWPNVKGGSHHWFIEWLDFARSQLTTDHYVYLDADEVLSDTPECHAVLREAAEKRLCLTVDRLNFWRDAQSLIPDGHCCGKWCTRVGPTEYQCVSDEPRHAGERPIIDEAIQEPRVQIFHLGFLRQKDAFYRKARTMLTAWFNRFDPRLEKGEKEGKPVWETECEFSDKLVPFNGYLPDAVQLWLSERGFHTPKYLARVREQQGPRIEVVTEQRQGEPLRVLHSGDFGDLIYGLPVFKGIGAVDLFLVDRNITKPLIRRMAAIVPLLEAQPYIRSVQAYDGGPIDWNASDFRSMNNRTQSLGRTHYAHYLGQKHLPEIKVDFTQPWLTCTRNPQALNAVVINRTARYHNDLFPWRQVVEHYGYRLLFVGTTDEHQAFTQEFGAVTYRPTSTMMEVAELIHGSALFIGNQSSPFAIAEGLKHPRIQETCLFSPDCIYGGASYGIEGGIVLPDVAGSGRKEICSKAFDLSCINTIFIPKGGWQYNSEATGKIMTSHIDTCAREVRRKLKHTVSMEEAQHMVLSQNVLRQPRFFAQSIPTDRYNKAFTALQNASVQNHPLVDIMAGKVRFNA